VLDLDALGAEAVARALGKAVAIDVPVTIAGAKWVYPRAIAAAQDGDRVMVYAQLPKTVRALDVVVGGAALHVPIVAATPALVEHAIAAAQLDELELQLAGATGDRATTLRADILKRSLASRIVSTQTAMLVLETDDDYARFGIRRDAPIDILGVGEHGVVKIHREPMKIAAPPARQQALQIETKPGYLAVDKKVVVQKEMLNDPLARDVGGQLSSGGSGQFAGPTARISVEEHELRVEEATVSQSLELSRAAHTVVLAPPRSPEPPRVAEPTPAPRASHAAVGRIADEDADGLPDSEVMHGEALALDEGRTNLRQARDQWPPANKPAALTGPLADIEHLLAAHDVDHALAAARDWHARAPGDVLALVALGDALEAKHADSTAARVYGSIIDLFPARADLRRFAGERLERLGTPSRWLAIDTYRRAVADRPDHVTGHRLLAYALARDGQLAAAFTEILAGIDHKYPSNRFAGAERVLAEDAAMIGAALAAKEPGKRAQVVAELAKRSLELATKPSTRFVLYWETDANDVDLHVQDKHGNHAWYSNKQMPTGGELYADVTTGYGPECFAITGAPNAGPYRLSVDYYSQGPMGYGMGLVQVQQFDGKAFRFDDRPFVVMTDHAYVDLGTTP
jgi:hypothetical protein